MKVVLFCGGSGTRLREHSDTTPKPLVTIGHRPLLWHLMRYYTHYGHTEFILCLGYGADLIRDFFLDYNEARFADVEVRDGGRHVELLAPVPKWKVSLVDTGIDANVGQRLRAVADLLGDDEMFLANYSDGLTDLELPEYVADFEASNAIGSFVCVRPSASFHRVAVDADRVVTSIRAASDADIWINGGFFVFRKEIFEYLREGEDLVEEPFARLIAEQRLRGYAHEGFWAGMDTFKDKQMFEALNSAGDTPWMVWKH
jgi:glucose-1-phosphate cytidylyltransferase